MRAVNKTIAEGGDYRNGTLLVKNSIGQHFTGSLPMDMGYYNDLNYYAKNL